MAKFVQFAGSPDIFNQQGQIIDEGQARSAGLFLPNNQLSQDVTVVGTPRPDIKTEADFATVAGTNLDPGLISSFFGQPSTGEVFRTEEEKASIAATGRLPSPSTQRVQVDVTEPTFGQDLVQKSPITEKDMFAQLERSRAFQAEKLRVAQDLATAQTNIAQQIIDIKGQKAEFQSTLTDIGNQEMEALNKVRGQAIPISDIVGQGAAVQRAATLQRLQTEARIENINFQEANLIDQLGLINDAADAQIRIQQQGMDNIFQDLTLQFKIQDRIDDESDRIFDRARLLDSDARGKLLEALEILQGTRFSELTPEAKVRLTKIAEESGYGIDILNASLDKIAEQEDWDRIKEEQKLSVDSSRAASAAAGARAGTQGERIMAEARELYGEIDEGIMKLQQSKGVNEVSLQDYEKLREGFTSRLPGEGELFDEQYGSYLSDQDQQKLGLLKINKEALQDCILRNINDTSVCFEEQE